MKETEYVRDNVEKRKRKISRKRGIISRKREKGR
jgi:hypothetical protein